MPREPRKNRNVWEDVLVGVAVESVFLLFGPTVFAWMSGVDVWVPIRPVQVALAGGGAMLWGGGVLCAHWQRRVKERRSTEKDERSVGVTGR